MGIQSAMFSGVSGLNTNSQAMSVIGNNLANTNTIGFKGARTVFSDLLSSTVFGSGGTAQVGRGVGLSTIDNVFSQGTFETTASDTDVAIEGDGFFIVKEPGNDTPLYTRAGAFRFNEDGYLVNPEGFRVQGKLFDPLTGELAPGDPADIQVKNTGLVEARKTSEMTFTTNLDASAPELGAGAIDPTDRTTYNLQASSQVFDTLGDPHLLSVYWRLEDAAANQWGTGYTIDGDPATYQALGGLTFDAQGHLPDTDADGKPDPVIENITIADWGNGSETNQAVALKFDCTQFDSESKVIGQNQDGFGAGNLTNVAINSDGTAVASYSNGTQVNIATLVLGKFKNPNGLELAGSNLYTATTDSGSARVGLPGPELGKIFTNSLEQSNVDMGQEFVKMITAQRGFQANSKIISTVDELLGELINLKR
ncbi:MAG: flagellar hook protein FlgE [Desulfobulbus sp.]|nr:MAG: flagellar hook protein FlgE [Desulfobulbus sp.]